MIRIASRPETLQAARMDPEETPTDAGQIAAATLPPLPGEATFADALRVVRAAMPEESETLIEDVAEALILRSVRLVEAN